MKVKHCPLQLHDFLAVFFVTIILLVGLANMITGAGIVRSIGKNVHAVKIGDPVLLSFSSCSSCQQCKNSHPAYCKDFAQENYSGHQKQMLVRESGEELWAKFFGQSSFAQYSIISEASVVNAKSLLDHDHELQLFSPLGCGFQTGMGAIQNITNAGQADTVLILGLGAVGMGALMVCPFSLFLRNVVKSKVRTELIHINLIRPQRYAIAKQSSLWIGSKHVLNWPKLLERRILWILAAQISPH